MTNLQEAASVQQLRWRQRLLLGLPIAVGGLVAAGITTLFTVPQWLGLQSNQARFQQLEALRQQVPLLRDQLAKSTQEIENSERKQIQLLQMIEGSGEFATFLAQLDLEASRHGLQLELFEPTAATPDPATPPPTAPPPAAPPAGGSGQTEGQPAPAAAQAPEPLQAAGLDAKRVLLSARGNYPNLLAFMRAVEALSLLVVPSDFALELVEIPGGSGVQAGVQRPRIPEMKLALTYYRAPAGGLKPPAPAALKPPNPNGAPPAN
jgi:type IV pilus assembly protein PilO